METTISSSPKWFLRNKNGIVGLSKEGIKQIEKNSIHCLSLPEEKDGVALNWVGNSFYLQLKEDAPLIEELRIPASYDIPYFYGTPDNKPYPQVCSVKRLTISFLDKKIYHPSHLPLLFNEGLEYIDLQDHPYLCCVDGVVFSKNMDVIYYYPRSRKDLEYTVPASVKAIQTGAFSETIYLKKLICTGVIISIGVGAFNNSSIETFICPSGTINDKIPLESAFKGCKFSLPEVVPLYTHEQAYDMLMEALKSPDKKSLPYQAFEYLHSADDELILAFVAWLKKQSERAWFIDARFFFGSYGSVAYV